MYNNVETEYFVNSVYSEIVLPDLFQLVAQQNFKSDYMPDTGDYIIVIGVL